MRRLQRILALWIAAASSSACTVDVPTAEPQPALSHAPFQLTLAELRDWSPDGPLAEPRNVSRVELRTRFADPRSQLDSDLPADARVLIAPDGIDTLANHLQAQDRFNLYTFTHWSSVDVLNWFGGTAERNVSIPSRPWVEAAHRNGVKVLGTVFFAPEAWGGSEETVVEFLRRDDAGGFPNALKLIEIAEYYGFDGWLMNQETDLSGIGPRAGSDFLDFMAYFLARRPAGMEIHWYDSMLPSGAVDWQNELNDANARFLQDGQRRTADAMFVNYWWRRDMVEGSAATARSLGRSPVDVFTGADLWPDRRGQSLDRLPGWLDEMSAPGGGPLTSIALFANNYNFTYSGSETRAAASRFAGDPDDVAAFYRAADRLFGGDDANPAAHDPPGAWPGIGSRVPARSVLDRLPFATSFSAGHGRFLAAEGVVEAGPWHDMSAQDPLPSWQFAVIGNLETKVRFDFDRAWNKGNSLRLDAKPAAGAASVPLFKTLFDAQPGLEVDVVYSVAGGYRGASMWFEDENGRMHRVALAATAGEWSRTAARIAGWPGGTIVRIGIELAEGDVPHAVVHLGSVSVREAGAQ